MKKFHLIPAVFLTLFLTLGSTQYSKGQTTVLERFAENFQGEFSTARMASEDPKWPHVILTINQIWENRSDGIWFYAEQAEHFRKDVPFRSTVIQIFEEDGKIVSRNFRFHNKDIFLDVIDRPFPIEEFSPTALESSYCDIVFELDPSGNFVGKTSEEGCPSRLDGIRYVTNESYLTPDFLISWDRGWNDQRVQAFGAEDFGYLFEKIKD